MNVVGEGSCDEHNKKSRVGGEPLSFMPIMVAISEAT